MKPLRIYSPCWGPKHLDLLERCLGASLRWPKNFEAIRDAKWNILCHASEFNKVVEVATKVLPPEQIDTIEVHQSIEELTARRGIIMNDGLLVVVKKCIQENSQMLMATPDFIFGDGTIANMRQVGRQDGTCVSMAHPRVVPDILNQISPDKPLSNPELVTLAMKNPHQAWKTSEFGHNPSGTEVGGILWRRISPTVITLQHRMPSPYLVSFIQSDLEFLSTDTPYKVGAFGQWDHDWSVKIIGEERHRMVLSSDACFMAEVTSPELNCPPLRPINHAEPDIFWKQERLDHLLNHKINRQYVATFRSH